MAEGLNAKQAAYADAVRIAAESLRGVDLAGRARTLGLDAPRDGALSFRAFGQILALSLSDFRLALHGGASEPELVVQILALHYLNCTLPVEGEGELISFRELKGGQFYYKPFLARSVDLLVRRFGNDVGSLDAHLRRFDYERLEGGELTARIHAVGRLFVVLTYRAGDSEFGPGADLLFSPGFKRVYQAEDAAVAAGYICGRLCAKSRATLRDPA